MPDRDAIPILWQWGAATTDIVLRGQEPKIFWWLRTLTTQPMGSLCQQLGSAPLLRLEFMRPSAQPTHFTHFEAH